MTKADGEILQRAYVAYNSRDSNALLALVSDDVDWPNDNTRLLGKGELSTYWTRQWMTTRTHDESVSITEVGLGTYVVHIKQVVPALNGLLLSTGEFNHVHHLGNGLIVRLDIQQVSPAGQESKTQGSVS